MKKLIPLFLCLVVYLSGSAITLPVTFPVIDSNVSIPASGEIRERMEAFSKMTPREFKSLTGRKLTLKEVVQLKVGQKKLKSMLKKDSEEKMSKTAYIILVVLGLGFIPIGIVSDWKGSDWWVNLILSLLCWIPGVIHGLTIMKKYYN